ncbi:hypothetical protein B296_00016970 [Ensete ventricosum]|uniref:Uncharacterized protein n=1 Tax=Ensete ventricosum TaxID=4639 RepID=A0A427B5E0_ENSVE|nr:hypothetical protein B296_00016970 [Ensete ventricosum]
MRALRAPKAYYNREPGGVLGAGDGDPHALISSLSLGVASRLESLKERLRTAKVDDRRDTLNTDCLRSYACISIDVCSWHTLVDPIAPALL